MIRVFLNNVDITNNSEVDLSFVEKLDRELDEAFLVISHTDRKEQFDLYSIVDIFEDDTLLFSGRVSSDLVELSSFDSEFYNHSLSLIEHTKLLEKFIVKGKTFTQPSSDPTTPLYTLYDVVESLRKTTLLQRVDIPDDIPLFVITPQLQQELQEIIAPELSFKDVTLRQALDEVANILDSITRIDRAGTLIFDKFNELVNQIEFVTENYRKKQDITSYSTFLSSEIMNPVNESKLRDINSAEYYPGRYLWTTLRSASIGQFDFESSFIPTNKPIYEILETKIVAGLKVARSVDDSSTVQQPLLFDEDYFGLDITENIVEKNIFDTLEDKDPETVIPDGFKIERTKRNVIIYNYGKKGIQVGQTFGLFDINTAFPNILRFAADRFVKSSGLVPETAVLDGQGDFANDGDTEGLLYFNEPENLFYQVQINSVGTLRSTIQNIFARWRSLFRIKYIPIPPSVRYEVVRDDLTEVNLHSYGTINQKLRIVDLNAFTNNIKGRINQLSESELMLSHKVKKISDSFNIGDFTEDKFVITKKEVIVQRDHYIINYELNRNFNKISQFIGIDQEIRQWEISESGRTLDRDLVYNEFIELYADDEGVGSKGNSTIISPESILPTFQSIFSPVPIGVAKFESQDVLDENGEILTLNVPFYKVSGGGAFGFYYDFETNASAGDALVAGDSGFLGFGANRRFNFPVKYTNEIGRFQNMKISMFGDNTFTFGDETDEFEFGNEIPRLTKDFPNEFEVISGEFLVDKDNRERIKMSLLYHFISRDINEVVVGNKLLTHNSLFIDEANNIELRLFKDRIFTTRDKGSKLIGEEQKITTNFLEVNFPNMYIELAPSVDLTDIDAWAITDEDGFPFIMVNKNSALKRRVSFVFRNKHPQIQYTLHDVQTEVIELSSKLKTKTRILDADFTNIELSVLHKLSAGLQADYFVNPVTERPGLTIQTNEPSGSNANVVFNISNTDNTTVDLFISRSPNPDANNNEFSISLPPSGQSGSTIQRSYLQLFGSNIGQGVQETIFARAKSATKPISAQRVLQFTSAYLQEKPTFESSEVTDTSIGAVWANGNPFNATLQVDLVRNSVVEQTQTIFVGSQDIGQVQFFGLNSFTSYTLNAKFISDGFLFESPTESETITTEKEPTNNPTLNITNITQTEVTFTATNNDQEAVTMSWGVSTPLSNSSNVPSGNTITRTLSNLTRGFDYLLQIQAQASNKNPSQIISEEFRTENALADVWELVGVRQPGGPAVPFDESISGTPSPIPSTCPPDEQEALNFLNNAIPATTRQIGHVVRVTRISFAGSCNDYFFAAVGVNKHDVRARLITNIGNVTANWTVGNETGSIGLTPSYQTIKTQVPNGFIFAINVPINVTFDNKDYTFVRWKVNGNDRPLGQNQISGSVVEAIDLEAEYSEDAILPT